jgi:hypothetical protein
MLLLRTDSLPIDDARWEYQLKCDSDRAIAFKTGSGAWQKMRVNCAQEFRRE